MASVQHFSVQPCLSTEDDKAFKDCIHIEARSALDAAEKVLHEELTPIGTLDRLRAKVWHLGDDFKPVSTLVYAR